jgi:hypothetical protein
MVHDIKIKLPPTARRSKEDLKSFVNSLPPDTILRATYMRWVPWPVSSDLVLCDLQRVQPSWRRGVANLEHIPKHMIGQEKHVTYAFARWNWGRYYINRKQKREKSAATGIWDTVWNQIPETDQQRQAMKAKSSAVAMANRTAIRDPKSFAYPRVPVPKAPKAPKR